MAKLSAMNHIWKGQGLNPVICGEGLARNSLSHDMARFLCCWN